jgi:hypothetical protein
MNYLEFKEKLISEMQKLFPESKVEIGEVCKNNSTSYDTMMIYSKGKNISPCFRLKSYYDDFVNSDINESFAEILNKIVIVYLTAIEGKKDNTFYDAVADYNEIKDNITCRLVNRAMNQGFLRTIPYTTYLDEFAVTYSVVLKQKKDSIESIRVTNVLMENWNISLHDLHENALKNTIILFPNVTWRMDEIISKIIGDPMPEQEAEGSTMYVLSNQQGIYGATVLIYPDALKKFVLQYHINMRYLYILPSSIHESIIVPSENLSKKENFRQMVKEVNASEVAADEVLSNQILIYDCEKDTFLSMDKEVRE